MNATSQVMSPPKLIGERFWNAKRAADYVCMSPRTLLDKARRGIIPAHPRERGKRRTWLFLESELFDWVMKQS